MPRWLCRTRSPKRSSRFLPCAPTPSRRLPSRRSSPAIRPRGLGLETETSAPPSVCSSRLAARRTMSPSAKSLARDGLRPRLRPAHVLGAFLSARFHLRGLFGAGFPGGLFRLLRHLAGDVLAALDRLFAHLRRLLLDLVGERAHLLVLDSGAGQHHPGEEAGGKAAERQPDWVFLGDAGSLPGAFLHLFGVRRRFADPRRGSHHLASQPLLLVGERLLDAPFDVGLVRQRVHGVAHFRPGLLYLLADLTRVLAHCTSSLTLSTVSSGAGGMLSLTLSRPLRPRTAATAPYTTVTISAATHASIASERRRIRKAVSAPAASSPTTPAAPRMPAPLPACLPFSESSALASSSSWRTSSELFSESCLSSSPVELSRRSALWPFTALIAPRPARSGPGSPPASRAAPTGVPSAVRPARSCRRCPGGAPAPCPARASGTGSRRGSGSGRGWRT